MPSNPLGLHILLFFTVVCIYVYIYVYIYIYMYIAYCIMYE